jgi:hypothetical protein
MLSDLIVDNPDFKGWDEVRASDRNSLLAAAKVLNHCYPGQYAEFLESREPDPERQKYIMDKLREGQGRQQEEEGEE